MRGTGYEIERKGNAHQPGLAILRRGDLQFAAVSLDDLIGDSQAKTKSNVAGGEERTRSLVRRFHAKAGAAVLHFYASPTRAGRIGFRTRTNPHLAGLGIGL